MVISPKNNIFVSGNQYFSTMEFSKIIGRREEIKEINRSYHSKEAEFVIVYGRRRVGKTFLIREFFHDTFDFQLTGIYDKPKELQLANFAAALQEHSNQVQSIPQSWFEAFGQLKTYLKGFQKEEKKVVFIDEMPWLDTRQSDFLTAFEWFWNGWGASQDDLMLIVCGSATTWITDKLLANKGGLFNRATCRIYLHPFTLNETEQYLLSRGIRWSRYDIAECYMIMGGIPFYLKQLTPDLTYTHNIDNLFFRNKAKLWDEFPHLYQTLFSNAETYIQIVEALAAKQMGLTRSELVENTRLPDNGKLTKMLNDLANCDFVRPYNYYGNKKKDTTYQLSDYYTLFYLRFLKDHYGNDEHFWTNTLDNPSRRAWAGYAFEQVCKDHIRQIKKRIGIGAVLSEQSSWYSRENRDTTNHNKHRGAQIDMLIDRRDRVINVCEMKFTLSEFLIDKDYDMCLRNKLETFRRESKTKKALHLTFVTTYGVKRNMYSGLVQSEVILDDLFETAE